MDIKSPSGMNLNGNLAENWSKFKQRFMLYLEATEKISKPDKLKVALLLSSMGDECIEIFNTFKLSTEDSNKFDTVLQNFDSYFEPKKNTVIARYKFFNCVQQENETVDSFVTNLKNLAKDCAFENQEESLIRDLLIIGIRDSAVKEKLLIDSDLSLQKAVEYCRAKESSQIQVKLMNEGSVVKTEAVQSVKSKYRNETNWKSNSKSKNKDTKLKYSKNTCSKCFRKHAYGKCPAWGKTCNNCRKLNHFSVACRNRKINEIEDNHSSFSSDSANSLLLETVNYVDSLKSEWREAVLVDNFEIVFKIDTGSEVNIIPINEYRNISEKRNLEKTDKKLRSYTGHSLKILGTCKLNCTFGNKSHILEFFVVDQDSNALLGLQACEQLGLINRAVSKNVDIVNIQDIFEEYKDVFTGKLGKLPYVYDIKLKENAIPKIVPPRIIPATLRDKVKAELDKMVKLGILEEVIEPTDWVHPIVIVQKPNKKVRICMDPRPLNKYIKREHYSIPTQQAIFSQLDGAKFFSVLDASSAFLQIQLSTESSKLCTIATPFGRYKFCRLPYGLVSSPEVYQRTIDYVFAQLEGILVYIDDILVYGKTEKEHDERLRAVLDRARKFGLKLSKEKSQIKVQSVKYLGYNISKEGLSVSLDKIKAIVEYKTPSDKAELQRFLGMITYLGKFIPNLSDKTGCLRNLLGKNVEFVWTSNEQKSFEDLKACVTAAPVLAFFDVNKKSTISVDASSYGLGGVLVQNGHPVAFASSSLSGAQQRYSQIEKELLAVVNGCKKFHYYVYGTKFTIETDHKPLLGLLKKPIEKLSPRLQRMAMELFKYDFDMVHVPGKHLYIADALSRSPADSGVDTGFLEAGASAVHTILTASDSKTRELQEATKSDAELSLLKTYILEGWPRIFKKVPEHLKPYWDKKDELHCHDELIFLGNKLVVPRSMRKEFLAKLHIAHQGINSCQNKAKRNLYWANINTDIKDFVNSCKICHKFQKSNVKEDMIPHKIPQHPWEELGIDFMYLNGKDYLLVIDYHSKFIEVRKLTTKNADSVIMMLKQIFRTHGIPRCLYSDNGPPFDSQKFEFFIREYDLKHETSSPRFPRSNGMVERAIGTVKTMLKKVFEDRGDPNLALMEYNNTPKYNLPSPAQMLMGRSLRSLLPIKKCNLKPKFATRETYNNLKKNQMIQKKYHDRSYVNLEKLEQNQRIYIQTGHRNWVPGTVIRKHETPRSYVVKTENGTELRRNRVHLRPDRTIPIVEKRKGDIPVTEKTDNGPVPDANDGHTLTPSPKSELKTKNVQNRGDETVTDSKLVLPSKTDRPKRLIKPPKRYEDFVK